MVPSIRRTFDNPFQALREFDRLVSRAWDSAEETVGGGSFPVDIREQQDKLIVEAELPGYKKDEIDISVEQGTLTIEAERVVQPTTNGETAGKTHVNERRYTRLSRRFSLPSAYDTTNVDAELSDGVLTLTLPKREESKPKKIQVK